MVTVQKGLWQDKIIDATRAKLADLYEKNPDIIKSEKRCILEYWGTYEDLPSILGDKWEPFKGWFTRATSPETITRCLRALKQDSTISLTNKERNERREREEEYRQYWGNDLWGGRDD
jgi:hypothetical protein